MAFEFIFVTKHKVEFSAYINFLQCIKKSDFFNELRSDSEPEKLEANFSFEEIPRKNWPEDFSILVADEMLYISFHSATENQRTTVLNILTNCLEKQGIIGNFEEL